MRKTTTAVTTLANKSTTVGMMPATSGASTADDGCDVLFGHAPTSRSVKCILGGVHYMELLQL